LCFFVYKFRNRGFAQIEYNAFKNPTEIFLAGKDRISYDYGILKTRAVAYYGSTNTNKLQRPIRKFFSSDKTVEIITQGTATRIITYLTGDPYSANYMKIDRLSSGVIQSKINYHLHRDNQGTILAITNTAVSTIERRYFDAWGNLKEARLGASNTTVLPNQMGWVTSLLIDRGYTGHEHLTTVGLIHMNGRIYDPILRQFMSPDNYVQDPYNTQNFNRFGYVLNNPLLYTDPSGEILVPILIGVGVAMLTTAIANISQGIPFWHGMGKAAVVGAISAAISFGIGEAVTGISSFWAKAGLQAGLHGMKSGIMSAIEGGDFLSGFAAGAVSSLVSSGVEALGTDFSKGFGQIGVNEDGGAIMGFAKNAFGNSSAIKAVMIASGGLSGGLSSSIAGGSFWSGVREGIITSGLNALATSFASKEKNNPAEGNEGKGKGNSGKFRRKTSSSHNGEIIDLTASGDQYGNEMFNTAQPEANVLKVIIHSSPDHISDNVANGLYLNASGAHVLLKEVSSLYAQSASNQLQITVMMLSCSSGFEDIPFISNFSNDLSKLNPNAKITGFTDNINYHGVRLGGKMS